LKVSNPWREAIEGPPGTGKTFAAEEFPILGGRLLKVGLIRGEKNV